MKYFGISEYYRPIPEIDHWLRRRVRMCYWKQWRYARTKVRELMKLGTYLKAAIFVAISRKGRWHLARTLATRTGMTNQWLKDQGLLSVKELWVNSCPAIVFDEDGSITRLRSGRFCEPPCALARLWRGPACRWCGEGEFKAPLYPIIIGIFKQSLR